MEGNRKREGKTTERTHRVCVLRIRLSRPVLRYTRSVFPGHRSSSKPATKDGRRAVVCGLWSAVSAVRPGDVGDVDVTRLDEPLICYLVLQRERKAAKYAREEIGVYSVLDI